MSGVPGYGYGLGFVPVMGGAVAVVNWIDPDPTTWSNPDGMTAADNGDGTYTLTGIGGNYRIYDLTALTTGTATFSCKIKATTGGANVAFRPCGGSGDRYQVNLVLGTELGEVGSATGTITGPDGGGFYTVECGCPATSGVMLIDDWDSSGDVLVIKDILLVQS